MLVPPKIFVVVLATGLSALGIFRLASKCPAQGDTWSEAADMPTARLGLSTSVVDGNLFAIGGFPSANDAGLRTVEAYDPVTDTWTTKSDMPTRRKWFSASAVDGKIYAIGGEQTFGSAFPTVEEYDVATDTWTTKADMPTARKGHSSAVVDGLIYAIGGGNVNEQIVTTVEVYDPVTNTWSPRADMPTARGLFSTAVVDGKIYAIGGPLPRSPGIPIVEEYDPSTDTWIKRTSMPTERWGLSTSVVDGKIYAIGGARGTRSLSDVEEYDPATDTWTARTSMPGGRVGLSTSVVDGNIYAVGGSAVVPSGVRTVQAYSPFSPELPPVLQAGDADQDLDFDQLDLVQVQVASKYRSGQAATWGDGDWDGAPGGEPGHPPSGDGFFNQLDVIAALAPSHYLTGPYGALTGLGQIDDGQTSIVYNAGTGELFLDAPAGQELTSINIDSASDIFTGDDALNLGGSFDNDEDGNIFKATFGSSFGSLSFGNVAQPGLAEAFLLDDLSVIGSLRGGGPLGDVDLIYVPEPSSSVFLALGIVVVLVAAVRGAE